MASFTERVQKAQCFMSKTGVMVVSEQATRQFMLGINKVEQGYIEGKYRKKGER